jgi:enolase
MQEYMILPTGAASFKEAMQIGSEIYHHLKKVIKSRYGADAVNVGDEGGFAPPIVEAAEAWEVLKAAVDKSGHADKVRFGMDVAASEFYDKESKRYNLNKWVKDDDGSNTVSSAELMAVYEKWLADYPLVSLEDGFDEDDWEGWTAFQAKCGDSCQIVGDDLLVTNVTRIDKAITDKACNALLLKVNQIGSLTESIDAVKKVKAEGWGVMTSHRSGETEDCFIADLAVGLSTGQIKTGAPCRSERLAKYNQLLRIEEELGDAAVYAGAKYRTPCKPY